MFCVTVHSLHEKANVCPVSKNIIILTHIRLRETKFVEIVNKSRASRLL